MSTKQKIALFSLAIATATAIVGAQMRPNVRPSNGYVPNAETAAAIGVAVLTPIYGQANVAKDRPYTATLAGGIWTVRGTLPQGVTGGTAVLEIAKEDGRILRIFHEQ
jgi:hypothetical protein